MDRCTAGHSEGSGKETAVLIQQSGICRLIYQM